MSDEHSTGQGPPGNQPDRPASDHPDPDQQAGPDQHPDPDRRPEPSRGSGPAHAAPRRISRRTLLAGGAVAAAAAAGGVAATSSSGGARRSAARTGSRPRHSPPTTSSPADSYLGTTPNGLTIPMSRAIVAENQKPGTPWWISAPQQPRSIEGFADQVSAVAGDTVTLYVNTAAPTFRVEAYRMGYYGGVGGRLVWRSDPLPGVQQPDPSVVPTVNTIQCQWQPSIELTIGADWPPGAYLLKLVGSGNQQQFVPLCVRDDSSTAAFVVQHSVTTWQAYNRWGGNSLYYGNPFGQLSFVHPPGSGSTFGDRARIVSFDRPYDWDWGSGSADFLGNELPVVLLAESLGLDVTYWTDVDLHLRPQLLARHHCLFSLGHDEYWSLPMRQGATSALQAGTNLAFLGANACYRQIRFEDSPVGPSRLQVCYKDAAEDPMNGVDDAEVTGPTWASPPTDWAESQLIGSMYQDVEAYADMVVFDPSHWLLEGTGLGAGQHLPHAVQGEFDRYDTRYPSPANADVVFHSLVANRGGNYSDVTWFTQPGGGGVFASGNATFVGQLSNNVTFPQDIVPGPTPGVTAPLLRMMENMFAALGTGPASATSPSSGTWRQAYSGSGPLPGSVASPTA